MLAISAFRRQFPVSCLTLFLVAVGRTVCRQLHANTEAGQSEVRLSSSPAIYLAVIILTERYRCNLTLAHIFVLFLSTSFGSAISLFQDSEVLIPLASFREEAFLICLGRARMQHNGLEKELRACHFLDSLKQDLGARKVETLFH